MNRLLRPLPERRKNMYIKKSGSMSLINFDHFDGIAAEKQDNGIYRICLFKMNAEHSFRKLEKDVFPIGRYSKEKVESILAGIEKSIRDREMIYTISETEVQNA